MKPETLRNELRLLWRAHQRVGLDGKMALYSMADGQLWPCKTPGLLFWFGPNEIDAAVAFIISHFNNGNFPYTPLLLNPIVHQASGANDYIPIGSGISWASALTVKPIAPDKHERLRSLGVAASPVARGEHLQSGLKLLAFADAVIPTPQGETPQSCRDAYSLTDIDGEPYWGSYLLSDMAYLSSTGYYITPPLAALVGHEADSAELSDATLDAIITAHSVSAQTLRDAAICWERYDRHPNIYNRFGNDVAGLEKNLELYDLCAGDFEFFDSVGPQTMAASAAEDGGFQFLVHGLIPRGSIILLAGTGGTGKSSIAHKLCCMVATDWREDEQPMWLGQPVNKKLSKGICIYFSGEDGPAIIGARNDIFDPEKRAKRLMFQRMNFTSKAGDEISFAEFLGRLKQMPDVPLLVIDPARKYLSGDEDDSAVVSEFFEAIEKFAHDRNTSVIVVHHLSKGAKPKSARDVVDELRGSQVFIDRPRVVIGMFREGPKTVIGLGKCNIPPSLGMVIDERVFAHNPKTLDLTQLPGKEGIRDAFAMPADEE